MELRYQTSAITYFYSFSQLACFFLFSGIAAGFNIGAGYFFYEVLGFKLGWRYGTSVSIAFFVGTGVSFALNRRFTFAPSNRRLRDEIRTFLLISLGGLMLTVALSSVFRDALIPWLIQALSRWYKLPNDINIEMISHITAVGLVAFYSFTTHKLFSFGKGIRHYLKLLWTRAVT